MIYLKIILFPLLLIVSLFYFIATHVRNKLFDIGIKKQSTFNIPSISVGNLSVGGTGKTPMVEYLIKILKENYRIATLSRGYGRKTKGYILSDNNSTAEDIGDEPKQIKNKYPDINVVVDEKRVHGMTKIIEENLGDMVILDDAYQHRYVKPGFSILLTEYKKPFFSDYILPLGRLRESASGKKRADIIVVTKTPETISDEEIERYKLRIKPFPHQELFFSTIKYDSLLTGVFNNISLKTEELINREILLVTGIANPQPLIEYIAPKVKSYKHIKFPDHYDFKHKDIEDISINFAALNCSEKVILTTEKDAVRLKQFKDTKLTQSQVFSINIAVDFINNNNFFNSKILNYVGENKRNS